MNVNAFRSALSSVLFSLAPSFLWVFAREEAVLVSALSRGWGEKELARGSAPAGQVARRANKTQEVSGRCSPNTVELFHPLSTFNPTDTRCQCYM